MAFPARLLCLAVLVLVSHTDAAVKVTGLRASGLSGDFGSRPDAYVKVWCNGVSGGRTETIKGSSSPSWDAQFNFPDCSSGHNLKMEVWDQDANFDDRLGTCNHSVKSGAQSDIPCDTLSKGTLYFNTSTK